jgi:hypothetical protein
MPAQGLGDNKNVFDRSFFQIDNDHAPVVVIKMTIVRHIVGA